MTWAWLKAGAKDCRWIDRFRAPEALTKEYGDDFDPLEYELQMLREEEEALMIYQEHGVLSDLEDRMLRDLRRRRAEILVEQKRNGRR